MRLGLILLAAGPVTRCAEEEAVVPDDTCPAELAEVQSELDELTAECTPGGITSREGGVLVSEDGGVVLSVPPGALPADADFTITPVDEPEVDVDRLSVVVDIFDSSGNEVTTLSSPAEICLRATGEPKDGSCLGYLDTSSAQPVWRCEDECLKQNDDLLCGKTDHFTSFAILLGSSGGSSSTKCEDDAWLLTRREGGVVRSEDGVAFVSVPPGALVTDTTFSIAPGSPPANDVARLTEVYSFGPNGTKFEQPVLVCLGGAPSDSKAGCLGYIDETGASHKWVCSDPCLQRVDGTICGKTDHFTSFAILLDGGLSDAECRK